MGGLKPSRYVVASPPIHDSREGGVVRVLLSTRTTLTVLAAEPAAQAFLDGRLGDLPDSFVDELAAAGLLVDEAMDELAAVLAENRAASEEPDVLYHSVLPSASCQFGCDYCGQTHHPKSMDVTERDTLIQRLRSQLHSENYREIHISWFGGEPLLGLATIRDLTQAFRALAVEFECGYSATMVTNGFALTPAVARELATELGVDAVEVTLDGPASHHDQRRVTKSGHGTFTRIYRNLLGIAADESHNLSITVRSNVDADNAAAIPELIDLLGQPPLRDRIAYYAAPIHDWSNDAGSRSLSKEQFAALEVQWLAQMLRLGMRVPLSPRRKTVVCVAVDKHGGVTDPSGKLLNCTEHALVEGPAGSGFIPLSSIGHKRDRRHVDGLSNFLDLVEAGAYDCRECQMFPCCGGACPKSWLDGNVPCPSAKFNMPERLVLAYAGARIRSASS